MRSAKSALASDDICSEVDAILARRGRTSKRQQQVLTEALWTLDQRWPEVVQRRSTKSDIVLFENISLRDIQLEIPSDQITGRELCGWHIVTVECGRCGHGRVIDHRPLHRHRRAEKPISKLNWKCDRCGMTSAEVRHAIRVVKLPRNF